jgi:hypothetical protein
MTERTMLWNGESNAVRAALLEKIAVLMPTAAVDGLGAPRLPGLMAASVG